MYTFQQHIEFIRGATIFSRPFLGAFQGHFGLQIRRFSGTHEHNFPTQQNIERLLKYLIINHKIKTR